MEAGVLSRRPFDVIQDAVRQHHNILIIGDTGSDKTTLIDAIIHEMVLNDPDERIFILEDTGEIQCAAQNFVQYHTTLDVDMTQLLMTTSRMRPDRILVGEIKRLIFSMLGTPGMKAAQQYCTPMIRAMMKIGVKPK